MTNILRAVKAVLYTIGYLVAFMLWVGAAGALEQMGHPAIAFAIVGVPTFGLLCTATYCMLQQDESIRGSRITRKDSRANLRGKVER